MDPVSGLYFGQFVLGCHFHFTSVETLSKIRDTRSLCWRLDHDASFSHSYLPTETNTFVETWLRDLPSTAKAGYVLLDHNPSLSQRLSIILQTIVLSSTTLSVFPYVQQAQLLTREAVYFQ